MNSHMCNGKNADCNECFKDREVLKSNDRKMRMFNAIDEAFAKINAEFDSEENAPAFQEMYDAISMLEHKVHGMEIDARFTFNVVKESVGKTSHTNHFQ